MNELSDNNEIDIEIWKIKKIIKNLSEIKGNGTSLISLKIIERTNMVEWIAENYKKYGVNLEIVTDKTQEGNQFCKGFGDIGEYLDGK